MPGEPEDHRRARTCNSAHGMPQLLEQLFDAGAIQLQHAAHVQASGEKLANGEDILQVDTYPLTIYTAAGVQELHGRLRELEAANASLRADNADLRARLERIESLLAK